MIGRIANWYRRLYRCHALYGITRDQTVPTIEPRVPVTFCRATAENLSDVLSFRSKGIVATFQQFLAQGQLGILAYSNGDAIAHGWMIINRGSEPMRANGYFPLRPREALVHFCNVAETHRGKSVYQALLCELYRVAFADEPVDAIFIDTTNDNEPSKAAIGKTARFLRTAQYFTPFTRAWEIS